MAKIPVAAAGPSFAGPPEFPEVPPPLPDPPEDPEPPPAEHPTSSRIKDSKTPIFAFPIFPRFPADRHYQTEGPKIKLS